MKFGHIGVLIAVFAMTGCSPKSPEESAGGSSLALQHDFTLSQQEFDALAPETQFMVANKALSTMYRGLPADAFFDLTQGLDDPVIQYSNFISQTQLHLQTKLTHEEFVNLKDRIFGMDDNPETTEVDESIPARFIIDSDHPHQFYMARIQGYPISRDMFENWMAYFLANTIMFSPAREMESTDNLDVERVLGYLSSNIRENTIREVIGGWLHNPSRWRVSRSPENHALEMFELYLGIFNDTEEEQQNTLNGGKVCDYWLLGDDGEGYPLKSDQINPEGDQTLKVFGQYVSTCHQLYDVVSGHPRLIPRVVEVIVNYFLDGSTVEEKNSLIQDIIATSPEKFEDIFLAVMFSEAFLLRTERPKTLEENAFGFLHSMHYTPRAGSWQSSTCRDALSERVLDYMLDSSSNTNPISVHNMGWAAMDYKIGRTPFLPMDVLSFATYHKGIRECVLLDNDAYDGSDHPTAESFTEDAENPRKPPFPIHDGAFYKPDSEDLKSELENLNAEEFIDLIFLSALGRRADAQEKAAFLIEAGPNVTDDNDVVIDENRNYISKDDDGVWQLRRSGNGDTLYEYWTDDFATLMLDYISRLPEFYYYKAAN